MERTSTRFTCAEAVNFPTMEGTNMQEKNPQDTPQAQDEQTAEASDNTSAAAPTKYSHIVWVTPKGPGTIITGAPMPKK